ncbi:Oidioi.mRNA.OKI2018_I69.PAR.g10405.t1.cds [Oikopleura dioica]|uniref:Oidioi.mRNA.OKI2018_I69.PAR.g10405.t1.cds n=1 Tax=Oikopleura dioica TaxID=34765 RepID=A0ABN7RTY5_OIKDI|nr:Oidioi.mRNA.OKI2018_I69.PAR.g10405.t1.cds [Oikopleura dioica]
MSVKKAQNYVHVTIATLNAKGSFFADDEGNGFHINGVKVSMGSAVFCGKVLGTQEVESGNANALGICLDDGTGVHLFNDVIRAVPVKKGDYIKIFGAIKPSKDDKNKASVIVHVIRKIEKNPGSVLSCFMLEAIYTVAQVMGNGTNKENVPIDKAPNAVASTNDFVREGMDSQQSKVLGIVIKNETEQGAQCPKDFSMLGIKEEKLREILDQLADDGHIYSTIDEDHYKST